MRKLGSPKKCSRQGAARRRNFRTPGTALLALGLRFWHLLGPVNFGLRRSLRPFVRIRTVLGLLGCGDGTDPEEAPIVTAADFEADANEEISIENLEEHVNALEAQLNQDLGTDSE